MNPYQGRPDYAFWKRSVSGRTAEEVDPVVAPPFAITPSDKVSTAGSCFAQHISRTLTKLGYNYFVTEHAPDNGSCENYGVYPARFGNIYTVRQLLQTFDRAYGLFHPQEDVWTRADGAIIDPFRPQIEQHGFVDAAAMKQDRARHLACVRGMFEGCDLFIFTLGLTEGWVSKRDGAVFPVAPGVSGGAFSDQDHAFVNFSVAEMIVDLSAFITKLRTVNPAVRIVLTVSPVPLIATYEPRHVLVATSYSKAALRVVAEMATQTDPNVVYFPSYEIITGAHSRGRFFEDDLRNVREEGVALVMQTFERHFLRRDGATAAPAAHPARPAVSDAERKIYEARANVVCEEEEIDR